jgi:RHS repeat-associated protein
VVARYTHGAGIDEPLAGLRSGVAGFYEADGLGSITSLSASSGALPSTYTYDSYGKVTASTGTITNPFRYAGREFDQETGAYYYRARYYDQAAGRFLSEDRVAFSAGVNFYAYVGNSPLGLTDPTGLAPDWWNNLVNWVVPPIPPAPATNWPAPPAPTIPLKCFYPGECDFTPEMSRALDCFRQCLGRQPTITCGRGRHGADDPHTRGEGADFGRGSNPWLSRDETQRCFESCFPGNSYGQEEWNNPPNNTHYHVQYTPGVGNATGFANDVHGNGR